MAHSDEKKPGKGGDHGPLGDARPHEEDTDATTGGSLPQADVDDRPNVSTVKPEDYPSQA